MTETRPFDLTMDHCRAALVEYDSSQAKRDAMLNSARTNRDVKKWESAEEAALRKVREAFFQDTKDRNNHSTCMLVGIKFVRQLVERANEERRIP